MDNVEIIRRLNLYMIRPPRILLFNLMSRIRYHLHATVIMIRFLKREIRGISLGKAFTGRRTNASRDNRVVFSNRSSPLNQWVRASSIRASLKAMEDYALLCKYQLFRLTTETRLIFEP